MSIFDGNERNKLISMAIEDFLEAIELYAGYDIHEDNLLTV